MFPCTLPNGCPGSRECYGGKLLPCDCASEFVAQSCTTACGTIGYTSCSLSCEPDGACRALGETCNGCDDDGDGFVDEDMMCNPPPRSRGGLAFTCGYDAEGNLDRLTRFDTGSDVNNCGQLDSVCPNGPANSYRTCTSGTCGYACNAGFTRCGSSCLNLSSDLSNCGTCGYVCPAAPSSATRTCVNGVCGWVCNSGLTRCGSACYNLLTNHENCGTCGRACTGSQRCSSGTCVSCGLNKYWCEETQSCTTLTLCNGGSCFVAGTPVSMADGSTAPIETVAAGDAVLTFDGDLRRFAVGRVVRTFVHPDTAAFVRINSDIVTTPEHPFFVEGRWVRADSLRLGDLLLGASRGGDGVFATETPVESIETFAGRATTFNIEVFPHHNYFAGGVLVHNIKAYAEPAPSEAEAAAEPSPSLQEEAE